MDEQRAYEGLDKKALEDLCSGKGISFRKKATNQEMRDLLTASDQEAGARPLPDATENAETIRINKAANKLQLEHEQKLADLRLLERQKIAEFEREAAEREKEAAERKKEAAKRKKEADEREEKARKGRLELLAAEEKARQRQQELEQETQKMQQETARLRLQVKKAMEEQQKLYPLENPVYNCVDMWYYSGQFSVFNQFCYGYAEGDSNLVGNSCLSVNEVSECLSNVSEVNLELDQEQKNLIGEENISQKQIKVDGQVKALTEEGKGRSVMGDGLVASTACKSEPKMGNCDLLEVAQCSEKSSSLSVGRGNVPGRESLDKPRQPCELMALSSQQFGKGGIVEDECPCPLPVSCVKKCDSGGNVPVSVRGIDLPMEGATSVSKQLSVNSPVCWDQGSNIPSCVSSGGECVSSFSVSVEQTEGAFQPVMVEGDSVVSELVVNTAKAQEGNGPKFVSTGENGTVTRLHPVSVLAKSQRPDNSGAYSLPVANVWLKKGAATLSDQGDIPARAQGEHEGDFIVLPAGSLTTCNKEEIIPKLVGVEPDNMQVASDYEESCRGKERTSNLLSSESMSLPKRELSRNLPEGPKVIIDVSTTQKESVVAQESVPLEQALGEKGKSKISVKGKLLLREAAKERNPPGNLCKQFTATKGCEGNLIKKVSFPNSQKFSVVNGSTDFPFERSSVGSLEKVSDGVEAVKKVEQPYNQVAVCGQPVGKTMVLGQDCLHADSVSNQSVLQDLKRNLVTGVSKQNSFMAECLRMQGKASELSPSNYLELCDISVKQSPALEWVAAKNLKASVCVDANYLAGREKKDLLIAVSKQSPPHQPVNSVKQKKSGFNPSGQGKKKKINFAKESHRVTLKGPNPNGIEPKVWHSKHDGRWTPAINLLLLLMVMFVTNVLLLPRNVKMYNVPNLMVNPLNMLKVMHKNPLYVKRPCYTNVSLLVPINSFGTFHKRKDIPDLMCCVKRKTEAHYHIACRAKCQDSCTMNNINIYIGLMLIGFQAFAKACINKIASFFSSWQDHMKHTGTLLQEQIQSTIVLTKFYLKFIKRFNHVIEHKLGKPFLLYSDMASNPIQAVIKQNPGWGAFGMQSVMFVSSLPASILRWGCDVMTVI